MFLAYVISHYIIPGHSNNHKAKLIHPSSLALILVVILLFQATLQFFPLTGLRILGYAANIPPAEVINITNGKRADNGLSGLVENPTLSAAAQSKAADMLNKNYWAHVSPDGVEPWTFFTNAGYSYRYAGENLARDFSNASAAVDAWMASPTHKENILSPKYQEIGIAVVEGDLAGVDTTLIVQFFGSQYVDIAPATPIAASTSEVQEVEVVVEPTIEPTEKPLPTATPKPTEVLAPVAAVSPGGGTGGQLISGSTKKLISPFASTRGMAVTTTVTLLAVLVLDGVVVHKRKIARIGGRTIAHLSFMGMILAIVFILKAGQVI